MHLRSILKYFSLLKRLEADLLVVDVPSANFERPRRIYHFLYIVLVGFVF